MHLIPSAVSLVLLALPNAAQKWPGFRGPNGAATSSAGGLPTRLDLEHNLRWKRSVPFGRSSPILTNRAVVVTGADESDLYVLAIDRATGEDLWIQTLQRARAEPIHSENDSAAPTPVTDGRNVYAFFPELGLVAFDEDGDEQWVHPLGPFVNYYGMSSSPILAGDTLLLLCDQQQGSFLLAVDPETGKQRWKVERTQSVESFTTPVAYPADAPRQVIVSGSFFVHGYSLENGAELWKLTGFAYSPMPSPTVHDQTLYVCSPHPPEFPMPEFDALLAQHDADQSGQLTASELATSHLHFGWLDADKDGNLLRDEYEFARAGMRAKDYGLVAIDLSGERPVERWRLKKGLPMIASPLFYDGTLYLARDGGLVTTVAASSGEVLARERLPEGIGECFPSPVAADGKIYFVSNSGRVAVLAADSEWNVLSSTKLGEDCFASPAIGTGSVFVRTSEAVYCFAARE